jgi:hypothetical protein
MSDALVERVRDDYARHIADLRPYLPRGVLPLARDTEPISMHDGHFISVRAPHARPGRLIFDIACWDMAHGTLRDNVWTYPDLHVRVVYDDAQLLRPKTLRQLDRRARDAATEILYDEFDRSAEGQAFEHRMLLWPPKAGFVVVRFGSANVTVVRFDGTKATVLPGRPQAR